MTYPPRLMMPPPASSRPPVEMIGDYVWVRDEQGRTVAFLNALSVGGIVAVDGHRCELVIDSTLIELPVPAQTLAETIEAANNSRRMRP